MRWTAPSRFVLSLALISVGLAAVGCGGPFCEDEATCANVGVEDALDAPAVEERPPPASEASETPPSGSGPSEEDPSEAEPSADEDGKDTESPPPLDQDKSPFGDIYGVAIEAFEGTIGSTTFDAVEPWAFADAEEGVLELTIDFRDEIEGDGFLTLTALWPDFPAGHSCDVALNEGGALLQASVDVDDDRILDVATMARTGDLTISRTSEHETRLELEATFGDEAEPVVLSVLLTR